MLERYPKDVVLRRICPHISQFDFFINFLHLFCKTFIRFPHHFFVAGSLSYVHMGKTFNLLHKVHLSTLLITQEHLYYAVINPDWMLLILLVFLQCIFPASKINLVLDIAY